MADNLSEYVGLVPGAGVESIEVAGGTAAFTGAGSPLTTVKGAGAPLTPADIGRLESFFGGHGATRVTIEMAPWPDADYRQLLFAHGYVVAGREDVVVATCRAWHPTSWRPQAMPAADWCDLTRTVLDAAPASETGRLLGAAAGLGGSALIGVHDGDRWVAAAQSVTYGDVVIFGNDATLPAARRRGVQAALIGARLAEVPMGAHAVAEVAPASGSERNYLRGGFRVLYTRETFAKSLS